MYDIVIPAGGTISDEYAAVIGTPFRPLAPVGGVPVLQRVVNGLRESGIAGRIIAVAPPEVEAAIMGVDCWKRSVASGPENILTGLGEVAQDRPAFVCASDLPFLTPEAVRAFAAQCSNDNAVSVGLVSAATYRAAFPGTDNQFVPLRDAGPVTLCSFFRVPPGVIARSRPLLEQFFAARKSQPRMALLLGPRLLWQFATKQLTLAAVAARAQQLLQASADIIQNAPPELTFDIDHADDYAYATAVLGQRNAAADAPLA